MRLRTRALLLLALAIPAVPVSARAAGGKKGVTAKPLVRALGKDAKADYDSAKVLASDGDYGGALIKFQSAYDQSKDPRLLWNIAFCEKNLRHYSKVIAALNQYLSEGAGYLTEKDRSDARELIQMIVPFTTEATVSVSELGAQIFVDDLPVGTSPLSGPLVLDIGERHIRVAKEGFAPFEKTLPVGGSASVLLEVKLQKEVHEGRIVVNAPAGAAIEVDGKPMGRGKVDATFTSGGHQLRVVAAGRRPYQTEVVVTDKESRVIDVSLEQLPEPEKPKIRVAVGCDGPEPLGPDDGLVVYLDGPEVLPPVNVKKRWSDDAGRNVVTYVEYAAAPGTHRLRARIPDCEPLETAVMVDAASGADVKGALPSDTPTLLAGPQGTPGHWRLGVDAWFFSPSLKSSGTFRARNTPDSYSGGYGAATGVSFSGALVARWFTMSLRGAVGEGSVHRASYTSNYVLPTDADVHAYAWTFRMAFRIPFNLVALNVGPEAGLMEFDMKKVRTGQPGGVLGTWAALDLQPLCDWGMRALFDLAYSTDLSRGGNGGSGGPVSSLEFGIFFEPNGRCRREQATDFGLRSGAKR